MVAISLPPPARPTNPRWSLLPVGTRLRRIYNRRRLGPGEYNHNGPRHRFDHHPPGLPTDHLARGIYYAADTLAGCIVEVFGDSGVIEPPGFGVATVELTTDAKLLDLTGSGAWHAGTVAAICQHADRSTTQPWARYFYEIHVDIAGLKYANAHNNDVAYALFERTGGFHVCDDRALADPTLEDELFAIADQLHLLFDA